MKRWVLVFLPFFFGSPASQAALLTEGFDDISTLSGSGWVLTNNSSPAGTTGWFQGDSTVAFSSQSGGPNSYIAANFNNAGFPGNISNWLLTPVLSLTNGMFLSFYTRTDTQTFADNLEVRLSTNGSSSDVGATDTSVGDFTTLLLAINPTLTPTGYPNVWTKFTVTVSGLGGPTTGRFAFRYAVPDTSLNAEYIGIDTVDADISIPEPSTLTSFLAGAALLLAWRRRRH